MFRTAVRNVLAHKARLLMTVLAVMLGVAFVSGTLVFTQTMQNAFQKSSEEGLSHVDVAIQPNQNKDSAAPGGVTNHLSQRTLDKATNLSGVESATGIAKGFAGLADKNGDLVGDGFSTQGANYFAGKNGKDERYPLQRGQAPQQPNEIALDSETAKSTGYEVGDTVPVSVKGPVQKQKVVGIFTTEDGAVSAGGSLVLFDNKTAQQLFAKPGQYSEIQLAATSGTSQTELQKAVEAILPADSEALTGEKLADDQAKMIEEQTSGMQTGMLAFAGIALFVGVFIIANTFTMLVAQRTKELALLRAVGASRRQVTRSVLFEACAVGLSASVLGFAAGLGIAVGLQSLMGSMGGMPEGPMVVSGSTIVTTLAVGVVVTVLAAWLPARRAAKIPPVAAMGAMHAPSSTRSLVVRNIVGALLAGGGGALVLFATGAEDGEAAMGMGAVLLLIGVFVLTPLLARPLIAATSPVLKLFNVSGKLARQNAVRNPRRTAATASALMIGLTLITGLTVIATGVQNAIDKMATDALKADYQVSLANFQPMSPKIHESLKSMDEVEAATPWRIAPATVDGSTENISGVNPSTVGELISVEFSEGGWSGLGTGKKAVVDQDTADKNGWEIGSEVSVTHQDGQKTQLTVAGLYEGNQLIRGIVLDAGVVGKHMSTVMDMQVYVKTAGGATDSVETALEKNLGNNPSILVEDKEAISEGISQIINIMLNILYGLLAMAVIVAVLGVINTLAMSVFERGQEIGMLRAIGLDRRGVKRMVRLESLVISLFGGVMGIALGIFFGWAAGELIASAGLDTYSLVLPWDRLAIFLVLAAVVGMLAALWPARRAAKLNMLAAIKTE